MDRTETKLDFLADAGSSMSQVYPMESGEMKSDTLESGEQESVEGVLEGLRAVVAEDQGVTQLQLCRILKAAGVQVVGRAANGSEALELALEHRPDFVLMDMQMPVMDGIEAARRILEQRAVCIIMLTAYLDVDQLQEADMVGIFGYITKPVTSASLLPRLKDAISRYREAS